MEANRILARVVECKLVADSTLLLRFHTLEHRWTVNPGQFVMVGPVLERFYEPFLNRPFSICRRPDEHTIDLLVGIVGRATGFFLQRGVGWDSWLMGPLGRGFQPGEQAERAVLIAGGLGVAPMFHLAESLIAQGKRVTLLYGAKSSRMLVPVTALTEMGVEVVFATDDGTCGFKGNASELLSEHLDKITLSNAGDVYLAACGPMAMLEEVDRIRRRLGLSLEVSLESRMACGVGACLGCSHVLAGNKLGRVCCDGPVFDAEEVFDR